MLALVLSADVPQLIPCRGIFDDEETRQVRLPLPFGPWLGAPAWGGGAPAGPHPAPHPTGKGAVRWDTLSSQLAR